MEAFLESGLVSLTLSLCALFPNFGKKPVISLQQISTLRCQKYAWFYSKFNSQSDELSPSFPKFEKTKQWRKIVDLHYPSSTG